MGGTPWPVIFGASILSGLIGEAGVLPIFSEILRQRRMERGLSQAQLARKADLSPSAVCRLEAGLRLPSRDTVARLARALELSPEESKILFEHAGFVFPGPSQSGWEEENREGVEVW